MKTGYSKKKNENWLAFSFLFKGYVKKGSRDPLLRHKNSDIAFEVVWSLKFTKCHF